MAEKLKRRIKTVLVAQLRLSAAPPSSPPSPRSRRRAPTLSALHVSQPEVASAPRARRQRGPAPLRKDSNLPLPLAGTKRLHFGRVSAFFRAT